MSRYPVLTDDSIWPEFLDAVQSMGDRWTAPSGRVYELGFDGLRLVVWLHTGDTGDAAATVPADDIDADLLEFAAAVHDAAGGIWSGDAVRQTAAFWGFAP